MTTKTLTENALRQFTGSEQWFRHGLNRNILYTEGAQYVAEHGGAYWLLDSIAIAQTHIPAVKAEEFQLWTLKVNADHTAMLTCEDGNCHVVHQERIPFTDFPLEEIKLYYCNNVIHLPSEY